MNAALLLLLAIMGEIIDEPAALFMSLLAAMGLAASRFSADRVPRRAGKRGYQMYGIDARAVERMTVQPVKSIAESVALASLDLDLLPYVEHSGHDGG